MSKKIESFIVRRTGPFAVEVWADATDKEKLQGIEGVCRVVDFYGGVYFQLLVDERYDMDSVLEDIRTALS